MKPYVLLFYIIARLIKLKGRKYIIQPNNHLFSWETEFGNIFANRRVMVTGATGFVGSHLCETLVTMGAEVYGISRSVYPQGVVSGCKFYQADLNDIKTTHDIIKKIEPQIVYHLAGMVDTRRETNLLLPTLQNNLINTIHLLMCLTTLKCERVVIVGSSEESINGTIPTSPYAAAKQAATAYAQMFHFLYQVPTVVIRPFMSYGPRQPLTKVIPYTITSLLQGESPQLSSGQRVCDFVYVLDVIRGLLKAGLCESAIGEIIDLGTGKGTHLHEVVELLVRLTNSSLSPTFKAIPDRMGEYPQVANIQVAQRVLDWQPRWLLRDGLIETINWYHSMLINKLRQ